MIKLSDLDQVYIVCGKTDLRLQSRHLTRCLANLIMKDKLALAVGW